MTDHFDGKRFYNPTLDQQFNPGLVDLFRMFREKRTAWPKSVPNQRPSKLPPTSSSDDIRLTFVNHATFLIQIPGLNILTDPVWSRRASPLSWLGPKRVRKPGFSLDELPPIDLILISHNHYDHLDVKTLKKLRHRFSPQVLVPLGNQSLIRSLGFENVRELDWWQEIEIDMHPKNHVHACPTFFRPRPVGSLSNTLGQFLHRGDHPFHLFRS